MCVHEYCVYGMCGTHIIEGKIEAANLAIRFHMNNETPFKGQKGDVVSGSIKISKENKNLSVSRKWATDACKCLRSCFTDYPKISTFQAT